MADQKLKLANAIRNGGWLTAVTVAVWLVLLGPVGWWRSATGVEGMSYAAILCLIPGWLVFLMDAIFAAPPKSSRELFVPMAGMFLRLVFVMGGVLLIQRFRPELGLGSFLAWVVVFYLVALAAETRVMLKPRSTATQPVDADSVSKI